MTETYRHKGLRRKLVESLRNRGITNEAILQVINTIPRHYFLDKAFEEWAYQDKAFPIGNKQTISQPYTVAYQTDLLAIKKRDKVMEIGTGSGYQAAVLAALGARVFSIERQEALHKKAKSFLPKLGYPSIRLFYKDGYKGLPEFAPFDKILVTAGATKVPEALKQQLKIKGLLVIPVGDAKRQQMLRITRISETEFMEEAFDLFAFVPFKEGVNGVR
ncbi:MAG: protein-L-isoaspartate(D-aspartate) O-methyltransferase [Saprospiraceae bacterium]